MRISEHSLGRILAFVNHLQNDEVENAALSEGEAELFERVRLRAAQLDRSSLLNGSFSKLLEHESQVEPESIDTTIDFYLAIFKRTTPDPGLTPEQCNRLIIHLNNHFHFFERFTEVMRGYQLGISALNSVN